MDASLVKVADLTPAAHYAFRDGERGEAALLAAALGVHDPGGAGGGEEQRGEPGVHGYFSSTHSAKSAKVGARAMMRSSGMGAL
jgi:hypothetical protein